jgi:hypothetical protein
MAFREDQKIQKQNEALKCVFPNLYVDIKESATADCRSQIEDLQKLFEITMPILQLNFNLQSTI